jgi:signal transduction histidine kinase
MQGNGMRLLKLINDLLDLVRLQSGRMEIRQEPVTIEAVLRGLSSAIGKTAEDRGIRLEISCDETIGTVLTDRDKLERILLNLLFNALKFTPAGGSVRVSARRENGDLRLVVLDNGVGITDEDLPFIFDRFWQADTSAKRQYRGVGLGLALVKELVEAQGGTVAVTSKIGNGSQFTVSLPYHDFKPPSLVEQAENVVEPDSTVRSADAPEGAETSGQNLKRQAEFYPSIIPLRETIRSVETSIDNKAPRVLIADDEPDMLDFLKRQFSTEFQVIEAIDGQQAIDKAMQFLPDVIVCDMMMPQKDGLEVCRDLRQRTSTQTIPILLLTARADDETKLTVLSAGANDFVSKPFSTTELRVRLKNLLESYRLQQELSRKNQILEATLEQLKETEAQLVQSEKLVSLGRMSAGLIHEINNPLNFAKTALYVLRTMAKPRAENEKTEFQETLRDVEEGITRVINIVSDLRTFTQPNLTQFEKIPVEEVISSALRLLSNQWQNRVRVEKEIANDQTIRGNRNLITHVLLNLLQNALYALERKTCCETVATIWIRSFRQNGEDVIVVRDNGEGIGPEDLNKVFDPFFTTKDVGDGMGLGLSICYRIMKQHGGRVQVQSERGRYSEFTLYFPHTATSSGAA